MISVMMTSIDCGNEEEIIALASKLIHKTIAFVFDKRYPNRIFVNELDEAKTRKYLKKIHDKLAPRPTWYELAPNLPNDWIIKMMAEEGKTYSPPSVR